MPRRERERVDAALSYRAMREVTRGHVHAIWEAAKAGGPLEPEDALYARLMQEHPEYHKAWEFADQVGGDAIIENQLQHRDPPEVTGTLDRLLGEGMTRHAPMHALMAVFGEVALPTFQGREPFNAKRYARKLRRLARQ